MVQIALAKGHEETDALDLWHVAAQGLDLLMMQKVHILLAHALEVVFPLDAHSGDLDPLAVFHIGARCRDLAQVDLRIEVRGKGIAMIAAIAVEDIDGVDGIEVMFLGIGRKDRRDARVKARAQKGRKAGLFELVLIGPLPGIVKVSREAKLLAALVVNLAPLGVFDVLGLEVRRIDVVDTSCQAGIHDREVLIRQRHIQDGIGLVLLDEFRQGFGIIGIDLRRRDLRLRLALQFLLQGIALGHRAAGNQQFIENAIVLAHLMDGNTCHTATADNHQFAHFLVSSSDRISSTYLGSMKAPLCKWVV